MMDYHYFKNIDELFARGQRCEARRLLMELQSRHIALHDEMDTLKTRLREFESIFFLSKSLHFERTFYWLHDADLRHGPFCPVCYDGDGALLRLTRHEGHEDVLRCPRCHARYAPAEATGDGQRSLQLRSLQPLRPVQARHIPFERSPPRRCES